MTWDEIIKVIMTALDAGAMKDHDDPKMRSAYPHIYGPLREKASAIISALDQAGFRIAEKDDDTVDEEANAPDALVKAREKLKRLMKEAGR